MELPSKGVQQNGELPIMLVEHDCEWLHPAVLVLVWGNVLDTFLQVQCTGLLERLLESLGNLLS